MIAPETALVCIVDDDPSVRKSLTRLVRRAGYEVAPFVSAREFLARSQPQGPSCLVLDVRMPGLTGLELQEALASAGQPWPIVFISGYGDIPATVKAMKSGAVDFLTKPVNSRDLLAAIARAVTKAKQEQQERARISEIQDRVKTLTPREAEVFALVVTGMPNKQIASALGVSEKMVKVHRGRVMEKMRAGSLAELVRLAAPWLGRGNEMDPSVSPIDDTRTRYYSVPPHPDGRGASGAKSTLRADSGGSASAADRDGDVIRPPSNSSQRNERVELLLHASN